MSERADAIILPGDHAPKGGELKKNLLFFDSLTLANPSDSALVNEGEVTEQFSQGRVMWASRNPFPRSPDYVPEMSELLAQTASFQSRGLIRVTPPHPLPTMDPGVNYSLWHSAIASSNLVEAAAPDRYSQETPPFEVGGYMRGGSIALGGERSKYEITESLPAIELADAGEWWTHYAHLRLGRALKFIRLSHALGLSPLALDRPNQEILMASGDFKGVVERQNPKISDVESLHLRFDFGVFDSEELYAALDRMTWNEVAALRKHTLPGMKNLRRYLVKSVQLKARSTSVSPEIYNNELYDLYKDFQVSKVALAKEWERLRIAAVVGVGGGVGGGAAAEAFGLMGTVVGMPWADLLIKIFTAGLLGAATLKDELKELIPARRTVKEHPMFFIDRLPGATL